MARTTSDRIWAAYRAMGAECVFGLPGSQTIDAFQALKTSGLRTVVPTHEMAAAFMAAGYARVSGKPGILTTIPGPGFTYALTGIAEAWLDSVPLVHVVPAARERADGEFALQSIDQRAMARPIVKAHLHAEGASTAVATAIAAYRLAGEGEPGPVVFDMPEEAFWAECSGGAEPPPPEPAATPPAAALDRSARIIDDARRVLLYLGAGAIDAVDDVQALAQATNAAIVTTTTARGLVSEDDARVVIRDPGMQDTSILNALADRADVVVAIGVKFSHNGAAGFNLRLPSSKLVTINAAGASRNYPTREHLHGDAGAAVRALVTRLRPRPAGYSGWDPVQLASWREAALQFDRAARIESLLEATSSPVSALIRSLRTVLPVDAVLVTDSGLHQMSVRRYYTVRAPHGLIVPTNFQSMGFALPAAIGAAIAAPSRRVVAVVGDGGMIMSGLELLTAVREEVRLTAIVFNDGKYSLIRNAQLADHGGSHGTDLMDPDFEALAAATGADYRCVGRGGIEEALADTDRDESTVRLVEVPLVESPGLRRVRARGRLRSIARRLLSNRQRRWLSRLRGR
jgi:acetolactate synthase-1/2/3 large subunit